VSRYEYPKELRIESIDWSTAVVYDTVATPDPSRFGGFFLATLPLIQGPGWSRGLTYAEMVARIQDAVGEVE
jgi:hypothetical protein